MGVIYYHFHRERNYIRAGVVGVGLQLLPITSSKLLKYIFLDLTPRNSNAVGLRWSQGSVLFKAFQMIPIGSSLPGVSCKPEIVITHVQFSPEDLNQMRQVKEKKQQMDRIS